MGYSQNEKCFLAEAAKADHQFSETFLSKYHMF